MNTLIRSRLFIFFAGIVSGIILVVIVAGWAAFKAPSWLVVDQTIHKADIAVVLGGGGGSRLRTGLFLYDTGTVNQLVLVDEKKQYWKHMLDQQCTNCKAEGKNIVILEGSTNTITDAQLILQYCTQNKIKRILIVTDPYHTRRALLAFKSQFKQSNIKTSLVSSGDYVGKLSPDQRWWQDDLTRRVIWDELGKILFMLVYIKK